MLREAMDSNISVNDLTYQEKIEGYLDRPEQFEEVRDSPEYIETLNHAYNSSVKIPPSRIIVGFLIAKELGFYDALMYQQPEARVRCLQFLTRDVGLDLSAQFIKLLYQARVQLPETAPRAAKYVGGTARLDLSTSEYNSRAYFNMAYQDFCYVFPVMRYSTPAEGIIQNTTINCLDKIYGTDKVTEAMLLMVNNRNDCHFYDLAGILHMWDKIKSQPFSWAINFIDRIPENGGPLWQVK